MIVGKRERFGIEAVVEQRTDGWVLGKFRFWLCEQPVGDWEDTADLQGCAQWLRDFYETPRDRYEPGLFDLAPEEVFRRVYDPVMAGSRMSEHSVPVNDAYARFHISHIGMSSFERFDLVLLKDAHGAERCLWREAGKNEISDCRLWRNEMESVAAEFCERFAQENRKE